jgi:Tol biopolymer transport system component
MLLHYRLVEKIGAGGMGEVWLAKDTRLDREVAVKILPPDVAATEEFRARFEREAKTISSLNHPHICTLHDVGHEDGLHYLVMERIDGESLFDRLSRGPMTPEQVVRTGAQIASALDAAHRLGIVHRDLKPGNVMLTRTGAKLLDFGLAKSSTEAPSPVQGLTAMATRAGPITTQGTILGTFQYMAPEQLEGFEADARTDIFALGALLYEMATGRRAFEGNSRTSLIAAIVSSQPPPISSMQRMSPPALDHVVRRCLEKDPDDRWQSAQDVSSELLWINEAGSQAGVAAPIAVRRKTRERISWGLTLLLGLTAALLGWQAWRREPQEPSRVVRFSIPVQAEDRTGLLWQNHLAISPDGRTVVYALTRAGTTRLYVRQMDRKGEVELPGTEDATGPFFSPDGRWVGFFSGRKMKKLSLAGGAPEVICETINDPRGATWAGDGTIYFTPAAPFGIHKVSAAGGAPVVVTEPDKRAGENSHRWPQLMPDGRHILFTIRTERIDSFDQGRIAVLSLADGTWRTVLEGGTFARYVAPGYLVFSRSSGLYAAPLDPAALTVTGPTENVLQNVAMYPATGAAEWSVSDEGDLVFMEGSAMIGQTDFSIVDRQGSARHLTSIPGSLAFFRASPDGERIAMVISAANDDVWIYDTTRGALSRLSFEPGDELFPTWSGDGRKIIYTRGEGRAVVSRAADGTGQAEVLFEAAGLVHGASFSPDGKQIAYAMLDPNQGGDIWLASPQGDRTPRLFLQTPFHEWLPTFSPDGRWLAYASTESGRPEIYVRGLNGEGRWQVSSEGGLDPRWSPKGDELFYRWGSRVYSAGMSNVGGMPVGRPQVLFESEGFEAYDVMPDGRHFLMDRFMNGDFKVGAVDVVLGWVETLRQRQGRPAS